MKKNLFWSLTGVDTGNHELEVSEETTSVVEITLDELSHVSGGGDDPDGGGAGRPTHSITRQLILT